MKDAIKTGLSDSAVEVPIAETPAGSGVKQRYYVEYQGRAADGSADTLSAGTMKVEGKLREGGGWEEISASTSMTAGSDGAAIFQNFAGAYHTLRFTPDSFEADHKVDVFVRAVDD